MDNYVITVDENGSPHLSHYGVLGMKWGVRHSPSRAYKKASKKASKLQKKADTANQKADKARTKARRSRYGITDTGRTIWENRQIRAGKLSRKADKATKKADKWIKSMNDVFSDIPVSEMKGR